MVCLTFIKMLKLFFARKSSPLKSPIHPDAVSLEVAGGFDAFFSLEDLNPDVGWREALATAWGVPYTEDDNE